MAKIKPLFTDATVALNKICILPYTDEELDAIGRLGFDMTQNQDFADKYMSALLDKSQHIYQHHRVAFAELNLQLYRRVLQQPDLRQIPDWITMPKDKKTVNGIKAKIIKMSQNIKKETPTGSTLNPDKSR